MTCEDSLRTGEAPRGNPSPKLAITVDPEVHAQVITAAADDHVSVSAWMTAAARRTLLARDGLAAVGGCACRPDCCGEFGDDLDVGS